MKCEALDALYKVKIRKPYVKAMSVCLLCYQHLYISDWSSSNLVWRTRWKASSNSYYLPHWSIINLVYIWPHMELFIYPKNLFMYLVEIRYKRISQNVVAQFRFSRSWSIVRLKKSKAIPVTGRAGQKGCETSRLQHMLDNLLRDGGEVVSLTRRPPFTSRQDSWYSFLLEAEQTPVP
jgi:hypothetical protein